MSISTNKPLGIPAGGTTGQVLAKASDNNYDFTWVPGGGSPVTSVFGRTAAVVAVSGDYNTDLITEATNLYFTNARAQAAVTASSPLIFTSGNLSINQSSAMLDGYVSSTDWNTFNNKGAGNITSVDVSVPSFLSVTNNPITTSGTITITASGGQTANQVLATPNGSTGTLSLRSLVAADIPNLSAAKITSGVLAMSNGGAPQPPFYGLGQLGDVTISSGTTTLTDDYYVNNLTISGTGSLNPAGYRIFVAGTLDLSNAPTGAIQRNGTVGNAGSGASGGTGANAGAGNTIGSSSSSNVGGNSGTGAGTAGGNSNISTNNSLGGQGGAAGSGGAPALAAGAAGGSTSSSSNVVPFHRFDFNIIRGVSLTIGGGSGASGGGANGDGTNNGGAGGSGSAGGCIIYISCNILKRDTTTATGAISAKGNTGGAGANSSGGNSGGGGGAGGGGGGYVFIAYSSVQGNAKTGLIDVSGGTGGAGGNGTGTGRGGQGGQGGAGGRVTLINMSTGVITESNSTTTLPSAATTPTTTAGTAGTAGTTLQVTL
jgi:hypothetical protein